MRSISCEFWQFNCWTFQVSFCRLYWFLRWFYRGIWFGLGSGSWRICLSYILGSGVSRSLWWVVWIDVLCLCLSLYLDEVDSHLLLSWAGSGCCDTALTLVKHKLRRESRAAVLPPSSGAARQEVSSARCVECGICLETEPLNTSVL